MTGTDLLNRDAALDAVFRHGKALFSAAGVGLDAYGKPPVGVVYAAPGAGKSELFFRLSSDPQKYFEQYNKNNKGKVVRESPLDPRTCLYAAVSFNSDTSVLKEERDLHVGTSSFELAVALRLTYLFLAPAASYKVFIDKVRKHAATRPLDWYETFELFAVVDHICELHGKERMYLMIDETMLLKSVFSGEGRDTDGEECCRLFCGTGYYLYISLTGAHWPNVLLFCHRSFRGRTTDHFELPVAQVCDLLLLVGFIRHRGGAEHNKPGH
jgi:hypothetical protein